MNSGGTTEPDEGIVYGSHSPESAFSLIEIMVVVALLSLIIFGLLAMFNETQLAFRTSMTQSDVLESGRMFMDLSGRELEQTTPGYSGVLQAYNFYTAPPLSFPPAFFRNPLTQWMPGMPGQPLRTNIMSDDVFFMVRQNQTWTGIGYFVRQNAASPAVPSQVGTLYRWSTNISTVQFANNPSVVWRTFNAICTGTTNFTTVGYGLSELGISKITDGVVHFRARAYDTNGLWIMPFAIGVSTNITTYSRFTAIPGEISYGFRSNAIPAYVDLELGVLEDRTYAHYQALATTAPASAQSYLSNHVAQVHLFRRHIALHNVDPGAYQ